MLELRQEMCEIKLDLRLIVAGSVIRYFICVM